MAPTSFFHRSIQSSIALAIFCCAFIPALAQNKKAVFVIVDGIPADLIEKLPTPNLDLITKEGGYARALAGGGRGTYTETPTISAVGYNTVLTGTWVNKHNVWDNDIAHPNYNYPTIFRLFKDQYPAKKTAVFSSWLDNRTKLIGEGLTQTRQIKMDFAYDGLELDTIQFPHDKERMFMKNIDNSVTDKAAETIREIAPDLSWVYLEFTDDMGHMYGDSEPYYAAINEMDRQMGRLWAAIQYRQQQHGEEWQIYITTDHGRDSATGKGHGGQSDREKLAWIVTNAKGLNSYFKTGQSSQADIMPSLARFLSIDIPTSIAREVDGVPLFGDISLYNPRLKKMENEIVINWTPAKRSGWVNIYISSTNHFRTGGRDEYQLIKKVKLNAGSATLNLPENLTDSFFKIVLEGEKNVANVWVGKED